MDNSDTEIEQKLILCAKQQPKTECAETMLKAAEEIVRLRSVIRYERARADLNNHKEELDSLYQLLAAKGLMDDV